MVDKDMSAQRTSTYVYGAEPYVSPKSKGRPKRYAQEIFNEDEKAETIIDTCKEPKNRDKGIEPAPHSEPVFETPAPTVNVENEADNTFQVDNTENDTPVLGAPADPFEGEANAEAPIDDFGPEADNADTTEPEVIEDVVEEKPAPKKGGRRPKKATTEEE